MANSNMCPCQVAFCSCGREHYHLHDACLLLNGFICFLDIWVVVFVSQMPCYACTCSYCSKLVNNVTRDEVDVIVSQKDLGIFHTFSS